MFFLFKLGNDHYTVTLLIIANLLNAFYPRGLHTALYIVGTMLAGNTGITLYYKLWSMIYSLYA